MSYYYNYFLGYRNKEDGLFYPLGPYDMNGNLHDVFSKSRSFASDLHKRFYMIPKDKFSDALRKEYTYEGYTLTDEEELADVRYLPVSELPTGSYLKKGYFLIDDIKQYEKNDGDSWDLFYDYIPVTIYAQMMKNELTFGKPKNIYDCEGEEIDVHSCSEYAFYMYPDYNSEEYESFLLREAIEMYEFGVDELRNADLVILETEG